MRETQCAHGPGFLQTDMSCGSGLRDLDIAQDIVTQYYIGLFLSLVRVLVGHRLVRF